MKKLFLSFSLGFFLPTSLCAEANIGAIFFLAFTTIIITALLLQIPISTIIKYFLLRRMLSIALPKLYYLKILGLNIVVGSIQYGVFRIITSSDFLMLSLIFMVHFFLHCLFLKKTTAITPIRLVSIISLGLFIMDTLLLIVFALLVLQLGVDITSIRS